MVLLSARQNLINALFVFVLVVVLGNDNAFSQSSPMISQTNATGSISACEGVVSASPFVQQFTISGANLVSPIVATAPDGFEISIAVGSGYGGQVTLTPTAGTVSNSVLYVRSSTSAHTGYISGDVVLSSSGAATQHVKVVGVIQKRPTIQPVPDVVRVAGVNSPAITFNTSAGTSTYTWTNSDVSIGLGASGTGSIPSFMPVNSGATPKSAIVSVTPVATGFAYVAVAYSDYVWVINTSTNTAVTKIKVGSSPEHVSVSADGSRVYVSGSNSISVISTQSNTVIATIPLNVTPGSLMVTPDGSKLYVTSSLSNCVLVISTATNEVITTINNITYPSAVAVSPDGHYVYVAAGSSLHIIDTTTDTVTSKITSSNLNSAYGICVSPDGSKVYISSPFGKVAVFDTATQQITTINVGQQGAWGLALSPDGRLLYTPNRDSNSVSVIDTRTNLVVATIPLSNSPQGISVNSDGTRVYAVTKDFYVYAINTFTNTVISTIIVDNGAFSYGNFITSGTGCTGTADSFTITVYPAGTPIVNVTSPTGSITSCSGSVSTNIAQFSVSGNNLTTDVSLSAPTDFEISLSANSGYSNTITIAPAGGNVNSTLVYARAKSTATVGAISGNISVSTTGAATQQVAVSGTVKTSPSVPTGLSTQAFCNGPTISNLTPTGPDILWYAAPTGGSPLSSATTLVNNSHYYASQSLNGCESPTRLDVIASVNNVQAPTGSASQTFCTGARVSDLSATGSNIKWYADATGSTTYLPTDMLRDTNGFGYYYYASQTVNGCESPTRLNVTVHINTDIPTAPSFAYTTTWQTVSSTAYNNIALRTDGTLWTWGPNLYGQLGDGTIVDQSNPIQVGIGNNWETVAIGAGSFAIRNDKTLWAWGNNSYGQLGDGTTVDKHSPIQVGTASNWKSISSRSHVVAIRMDGTLWAWGLNDKGQVGNGNNTNQHTPIQIGTDTDWAAVSAGSSHTLALKTNGTLWAWGEDYYNQLGDGDETLTSKNIPIQIGTDTNWKSIHASSLSSFAIKKDGTLWGWGNNTWGELGNGDKMDGEVPTQIGSDNKWLTVAATGANLFHNIAIKTDGTLWAWGYNKDGLLGNGVYSEVFTLLPIQIGTDNNWASVSVGDELSLAIKKDGSLWGWGPEVGYVVPTLISAPNGLALETFCSPSTVANLTATGTDIKWYASASGGLPIDPSTALQNGVHYFATQKVNYCESQSRMDAVALVNPNPVPAPTGPASQSFSHPVTINDLSVQGFGVKWYTTNTGGSALSSSTVLSSGSHYYASQTIKGCSESSARLDVLITVVSVSAPVATAATSMSFSGFTANWNSVVGATNYPLDISTDNFTTFLNGYKSSIVTGTSQVVTGLTAGIVYQYRVRATTSSGTSGNSNVISLTTSPSSIVPPVATAATNVSSTGFVPNWNSSSGAIAYQLDISSDNFTTFLTGYRSKIETGTRQWVTGLTAGTSYQYRLRSITSSGTSSNSNVISIATLPTSPSTPIAADATNISITSFTANWNSVAGATGYKLDISADNFTTFLPGYNSVSVTGTSQIVTGLTAGTFYQYRVRSITSSGTSVNSNVISLATLPTSPSAPVATSATAIAQSGFTATWNSVSGATSYQLDISGDNFATFLTGYNSASVTGTSQIVTGLTAGTSYQYRVRSITSSGTSVNSNVISVSTLPTSLSTPVATVASTISSTSFTANWNSVAGATNYQLDVSSNNFATFLIGYNSKAVTGTSQVVSGLTLGVTYQYRVRAVIASASSSNSNVITVAISGKTSQTIVFQPIPNVTIGDPAITLTASASSGLSVSFVSKITPAALTGNNFKIVLPGRDTITASQPGDATYFAATPVIQTFCINPAKPVITTTNNNNGTITLTSSAYTGNAWSYNGVLTGATSRSIDIKDTGDYSVRVKVDDCVSAISSVTISNIVTGNISESPAPLTLYPNPARDFIFINGIRGVVARASVIDLVGRHNTVELESQGDSVFRGNIHDLADGLYILQVVSEGQSQQIKFLKQ